MFRGKQHEARARGKMLREELSESFDHARRAAGHAADGVKAASDQMMPVAGKAREAATQRLTEGIAAFNGATATKPKRSTKISRKAMRKKRSGTSRRMPRALMITAAGVAVGAVGAAVIRRRRQQHWAEYDPNEALGAMGATGGASKETSPRAASSGSSADQPSTGAPGKTPADEMASGSQRNDGSTSKNNT